MTLQELKQAVVKSITVNGGEAIAVNPYTVDDPYSHKFKYSKWCKFDKLNLPPLQTSNIPDGVYQVDELEEVLQWLCSDGKWYICKGLIGDYNITRFTLRLKQANEYNYTTGEWERAQSFIEYYEEGALINVFNKLTGKTASFKIETKKVATKITKEWNR